MSNRDWYPDTHERPANFEHDHNRYTPGFGVMPDGEDDDSEDFRPY